jgi:transposase
VWRTPAHHTKPQATTHSAQDDPQKRPQVRGGRRGPRHTPAGVAAPGRNSATVREFFDLLGPDRCAQFTHVSADGADFIDTIVAQMCPAATRVADPFHIVKWATEALDEVRRGAWNDARELARTEANAAADVPEPTHHRDRAVSARRG